MHATMPFPATLEIDYPDHELDRFSTLLRPVFAIPIAIVLALVTGPVIRSGDATFAIEAGGAIFAATALMLVFRHKYPRWWFEWSLALTRFGTRVTAYLALLRDEYPATDAEQAVHLRIPYPQAQSELSRWLPLVKWFLAIPHYVVLAFLGVGAVVAIIVAWFAILFTGHYPRPLFDYVVGVLRWALRVNAYAFLLTTDQYPPFQLRA
jgi:hypothetical protein